MKYLIVLERSADGYAAYSPDLDGCIAAADTREETIALMREAIEFHLEALEENGQAAPIPRCESSYVEVGV